MVLLLAAMPLALIAGRYALLFLALCGLLFTLYLLVLMIRIVLQGLFVIIGWFRGPRRGARVSSDQVLERNWSIGLLHLEEPDPASAEALLRACQERAVELAAGTDHAGGVLVCRDGAVTTAAARTAVAATAIAAFLTKGHHPAAVGRAIFVARTRPTHVDQRV